MTMPWSSARRDDPAFWFLPITEHRLGLKCAAVNYNAIRLAHCTMMDMPLLTRRKLASCFALPAVFARAAKAQTSAADGSTTIDSDGTAHITRMIPVPRSLSVEAQAMFASDREFAPNGWTEESAQLVKKAC